jgi:hypothetical protein
MADHYTRNEPITARRLAVFPKRHAVAIFLYAVVIETIKWFSCSVV